MESADAFWIRAIYKPVLISALRSTSFDSLIALAFFLCAAFVGNRHRLGIYAASERRRSDVYAVTDPAISLDEATRIMSHQDEILKNFPEVDWAVGKAGRAETSTDPVADQI